MKFIKIMGIVWLLFCRVGAEDTTVVPGDSAARSFVPLLPDSLTKEGVWQFSFPEKNPLFQYEMGIILSPDPYQVELNPGAIHKVDPTVDLGMIYPPASRQKILLHKDSLDKLPGKPNSLFYFKPEIKKRPQDRKEKQ